MMSFRENVLKINNLAIIALMFGAPAWSAEKYSATVEDGTAHVIRGSTKVDEEQVIQDEPLEEEQTVTIKKTVKAPKRITHRVVAAPAVLNPIDELRQQNLELKKRLEVLEQAQAAPADQTDVTEKAAQENDVAQTVAKKPVAAPVAAAAVVVAPAPVAKAEPVKPKSDGYDAVPDQHVKEIAERLKYTNEILKRFGRAYDYRTTTLSQFKKILGDLEANEQKTRVTQ